MGGIELLREAHGVKIMRYVPLLGRRGRPPCAGFSPFGSTDPVRAPSRPPGFDTQRQAVARDDEVRSINARSRRGFSAITPGLGSFISLVIGVRLAKSSDP